MEVEVNYNSVLSQVIETINEVLVESGYSETELNENTKILQETDLDSMGLAIVVVKMEEKIGKDPFAQGFIEFHTVGELAKLYGS